MIWHFYRQKYDRREQTKTNTIDSVHEVLNTLAISGRLERERQLSCPKQKKSIIGLLAHAAKRQKVAFLKMKACGKQV